MDFRTLRTFTEVVRQGGFTQAAKTVFMTQSAVSKAVKQLEDELGVMLIDRVGHRSMPTAAGKIVYQRALTILAERADLVVELSELRGLRRGTLRLGLPPIGSDMLFAPLFAIYRSRYPGIDIELMEHGSKRLESLVTEGEVDLGASLLPVADAFEWQDVRREPIDLLIPESHPMAAMDVVPLSALRDVPFILFDAGFALNPIIVEACQAAGFSPLIAARSSQITFIVELVASGLGVGFLPRLIARKRVRPGVRHVPIEDASMIWHMAWIWRRGAYLSHAARAWLDLAAKPPGDASPLAVTTPDRDAPVRGSDRRP